MDEFLKAWQQLDWSKPIIQYKIYYDSASGAVLDYTTDELPGVYIVVDKDTFYCHKFDIKIKDGKIVPIKHKVGKLRPDIEGTSCHPFDITIITDQTPTTHWKNHTYDD